MVVMALPATLSTGVTQARHHPVHHHRAGPALRDAAAIFRAGHPQIVAQHPEQGRIAIGVNLAVSPLI
jgi:hypothetical protein